VYDRGRSEFRLRVSRRHHYGRGDLYSFVLLRFWAACHFGERTPGAVGNPSAPNLSTVVDFVNANTSGAYAQYAGSVTATSVTSRLEFLGRQDLDFYYVDGVSLSPTAVSTPEPSGFIGLAAACILALRRKRRKQNAI